MSVIVTNAKSRIAYTVARSLSRKNISVTSADSSKTAMTFVSRYSSSHFVYPSPYKTPQDFIECLQRKILELKSNVLIPTYEETFLISKYKHKFESEIRFVLPNYDQILIAHNKDKWSPLAAKCGVPTPKTYAAHELIENSDLRNKINFPVLIKPKQGGGGWAIQEFKSKEDLEKYIEGNDNQGLSWERFFIQEKIDGETICVAMLFNKGKCRAKISYRQLRNFPTNTGQATLRISQSEPEAEEYLNKMLETMNWHGVCQADFVKDKYTGRPYLIDINPRLWGALAQGIEAGVDFPYLLYKIAMDGDVNPVMGFKEGIVTRWLGGDIRAFFPSIKISKNRLIFLKRYFWDDLVNVACDDISISDPLPFLFWSYSIISDKLLEAVGKKRVEVLEGIWK